MGKGTVVDLSVRVDRDELTELIRTGARKSIAEALELEVNELLAEFTCERDERARARVVRNGYLPNGRCKPALGR